MEELKTICARGLDASLTHQCLIEESIKDWEELEVEVVRDAKNQMIAVCFIENIDAVGVHTGDSFCAAPFLTISKELEERLKRDAFRIVEKIGVIGGTNVQFAHDPKTGRVVIIEINPRTSRSSALASKATGFPIALVSAKLAAGMTLDEIPYWRDGTLEKYTPDGDYVVLKFARWAFEKFRAVEDHLGTQMKAVGEVMSIGKTYKETFQKAIRALERGRAGLGFAKDFHERTLEELLNMLAVPNSERHFQMYEALRKGASDSQIFERTGVKAYFVQQMRELVQEEEEILGYKGSRLPDKLLAQAKKDGFSDKYLAQLLGVPEREIREQRYRIGCRERWFAVPVSGVEDKAYYYSTYNDAGPCGEPKRDKAFGEAPVSPNPKKVMILGGGPNRIGQGIEFDYCCCHAAMAMRKLGYETIIVNCNPETVSTDYDTSDKLYFEPVTVEDVLQIYEAEKPAGVIVQFGGQTPLNIARALQEAGCKILGTPVDSIDDAEDRDLFHSIMDRLGIPMPESMMASDIDGALECAGKLGYPLIIRPSFVLGGRGMEVIYDEQLLREYVAKAVGVTPDRPLYLDRFLCSAMECEADALSDGNEIFIPAIMQHIEYAGVHSGDSACVLPPDGISPRNQRTILDYTRRIAKELKVVGLMNMQFAIEFTKDEPEGKVYVIEANPRASRTVPLVSKVGGVQMAGIATRLMLGESVAEVGLDQEKHSVPYFGVKEAVLPFDKFPEVDPVLGPEMRSTGEVLGLAETFALAYFKSQEAAGWALPTETGKILVSLSEKVEEAAEAIRKLADIGFSVVATQGTARWLSERGIAAQTIAKIGEGRPDVLDAIKNRDVKLIVNTPSGRRDERADDSRIRQAAIKYKLPYLTTLAAVRAAAEGIAAAFAGQGEVRSLQSYHASIK
ncbi:MAG: carbamoyl-phosphate synthase large subunit [Kiritimatiellae bacterium]|nr:carbamoyl-phosphate synthase large subunit [Kiritimatiellia bacterium]